MRPFRKIRPPESEGAAHRRHRRLIDHLIRALRAPFDKISPAVPPPPPAPKPDEAVQTRSPWGIEAAHDRYAAWVQNLREGDEVAIGNSHDELTDIARVREVSHARLKLENIPVQFWRVEPYVGEASGHQPPNAEGVIPYRCLLPVTDAYREWIAERDRLRDEAEKSPAVDPPPSSGATYGDPGPPPESAPSPTRWAERGRQFRGELAP